MAGLSEKQRKFVDAYLISGNATEAYKLAGYEVVNDNTAAANASRLLRNAKVVEALENARNARSERVNVTADMVVSGLLTEALRTGKGSTHSARVTAWATLGKHLPNFFVEQHEHSLPELDRLIEAELARLAGGGQAGVPGPAEANSGAGG